MLLGVGSSSDQWKCAYTLGRIPEIVIPEVQKYSTKNVNLTHSRHETIFSPLSFFRSLPLTVPTVDDLATRCVARPEQASPLVARTRSESILGWFR